LCFLRERGYSIKIDSKERVQEGIFQFKLTREIFNVKPNFCIDYLKDLVGNFLIGIYDKNLMVFWIDILLFHRVSLQDLEWD